MARYGTVGNQNKRKKNDTTGGRVPKKFRAEERRDTSAFTPRDIPDGEKEARRPKRKVACLIGYSGLGYSGMQLNPPAKTIEGDLFDAFVKTGAISKDNSDDPKKSSLLRAARTDKGVHAAGNLISLKLIVEDEDIVDKINSHLVPSIRLWAIQRTVNSFNCRKMCDSRTYEYLIPTHVFLSPRPGSTLWQNINDNHSAEAPARILDHHFWESFDSALTQETRTVGDDDIQKSFEKAIEIREKQKYRVTPEKLQAIRATFKAFEGSHSFHNYTLGKPYTDPSSRRFIKSFTVSDPKHIADTEWLSLKVHGQSFMLHQIRKMVAMAVLVVRTSCPVDRIRQSFDKIRVNIPKAPGLGLLLERPIFDGYNRKSIQFGKPAIDFAQHDQQIEQFKAKHIYETIFGEEAKKHVIYNFFAFIDSYYDNEEFAYLTDRGIRERDIKPKEIQIIDGDADDELAVDEEDVEG